MDSGSVAGDPSAHKNHKANEIQDITSKLPEPLIGHILSYLPTKDAVRTSVLSKRWINHWTLINKLDLDDSLFYSPKKKAGWKQRFINFVNTALLLIKCSSVETFSLVLAKRYDVSLLNTWISNILNRRVKNLRISSNHKIPFSALTCDTLFDSVLLEELVLDMWWCTIKVPYIQVRFQCLKLLKLYGVYLICHSPTRFLKLDLPVLQKFETRNCNWVDAKGVIIEAPLLESVYIQQDRMSVSYGPRSCKILFFALHLKKKFTYCGYGMSQSIFLGDPSSAHRASAANILLHQCGKKDPETRSSAFLLLKQFNQAKFIKFDGSEVLTQLRGSVLPVFAMLSHLELGLVSCEALLSLLQKSPVLKTLLFKGISIFDKELLDSAIVPGCFTSTLEVVKFEKVNGSEHELCLAKFFMENGMVLERISFSLVSSRLAKSKVMEEFKEKLYSFKNGFSSAIVEFSIYKEVMRAYNFSDFFAKT